MSGQATSTGGIVTVPTVVFPLSMLPTCPVCGGEGFVQDTYDPYDSIPCDCDHGKVTVAQMAALWRAVHDPDDTTRHMHDAFSLLEQLRAARP